MRDGIKGFYRGFWPQFWRDVPTYGIYFLSYDAYQKLLMRGADPARVAEEHKMKNFMVKLTAGGFAGMTTWLFAYPFDVVKSVSQQTSITFGEDKRPSILKIT